MATKDFTIKQKTSNGYDTLYPETRAEQVIIDPTTGATLATHLDDYDNHVNVKWQSTLASTAVAVPSNTYVDFTDTEIEIVEDGLYLFWGFVNLIETTTSNGYREIRIIKNGSSTVDTVYQESIKRAGDTSYKLPFIGGARLAVGEKFTLRVSHNNPTSLNCSARMLRVMKVGDGYR